MTCQYWMILNGDMDLQSPQLARVYGKALAGVEHSRAFFALAVKDPELYSKVLLKEGRSGVPDGHCLCRPAAAGPPPCCFEEKHQQ